MTHYPRLFLTFLLAAGASFVLGCSGGTDKTIPFDVLKESTRNGKLVMEVLVGPEASQQEVLKLAERLQREHAGKYAFINIFDSREAWRRRDEGTYPQKEFVKHYLVQIAGSEMGWKDGQEIHWVAKGRDH